MIHEDERHGYDDSRLHRRRSTTTTTASSDHEPLPDIRPSSRRFLGADEYYTNQDDDTSGAGGGCVEYAVMVPDSFAVVD